MSKNSKYGYIIFMFLIMLFLSLWFLLSENIFIGLFISIFPLFTFIAFKIIKNGRIFGWVIILIQAFGSISITSNDILTIPKIGTGFLFVALIFSIGFSLKGLPKEIITSASIWLIYYGLSVFWSQFPINSISRVISLLLLLITTWMISYYIYKKNHIEGFFEGFIIFSLLNSFLTIGQFFGSITFLNPNFLSDNIFRAGGLLINPNENAFQISLGGIILFVNTLLPIKKRIFISSSFVNGILLGVCILAVISTQSRGGLLSLVIGLFASIFYFLFKQGKIKRVIYSIIGMFGILSCLYYLIPESFLKIIERFQIISFDRLAGRLDLFEIAIYLFERKPIFGYGPDVFRLLSNSFYRKSSVVHNTYLEFLIDGGILNLLLFSLVILFTLKVFSKISDKEFFGYKIAVLGMIFVILSMMMTGTLITDKNLWIIIGIISGISLLQNRKQEYG